MAKKHQKKIARQRKKAVKHALKAVGMASAALGGGAVGGAMQSYVVDLGRMTVEKLMKLVDDWREQQRKVEVPA
jgi:hypothetical protein